MLKCFPRDYIIFLIYIILYCSYIGMILLINAEREYCIFLYYTMYAYICIVYMTVYSGLRFL